MPRPATRTPVKGLTDPFGLCWQIVPESLGPMMASGDAAAVQRMVQALWQMTKLDLEVLERAFRGE